MKKNIFFEVIKMQTIYNCIFCEYNTTKKYNLYRHQVNNSLEYLIDYLNIMASNGYSNENTNEYKRKYKTNIEKLKLLFNSFK
jgi:hypothetical protein